MAPPVSSTPLTATADADVECSIPPSIINPNIKQEKRDDRPKLNRYAARPQTVNPSIAFSITNILSNSFGHAKSPTNNNEIADKKVLSEKKNSVLFRPYDDNCGENGVSSPKLNSTASHQSYDEESNGKHAI